MNTTASDEQDRQDMARLAGGHDASLNDLMERHGPRLFQYLCRVLGDEADAADLAEESFVRVYRHRAEFDPRHRFATWLYTIASSLARDRWRWRQRHPTTSLDADPSGTGLDLRERLPDPSADPAQTAAANEHRNLVRRAIESLPADLRVPLILSQYEACSHAEIGAILKCSAKAVEMRLYRARQELRRRLAPVLG